MKLYVTATSPYARVARTVVIAKGLADQVDVISALTRQVDSPYYAINPSGRVPYLVRDDGVGIEDSRLIAAYLDAQGSGETIIPSCETEAWAYGRLEVYARSIVDGISVWVREMRRPENERSPTIQSHELIRARRLADLWENEIDAPLMNGPLNLAQLYLVAGLDFAAYGGMGDFTERRPRLTRWAAQVRKAPALAATAPRRNG